MASWESPEFCAFSCAIQSFTLFPLVDEDCDPEEEELLLLYGCEDGELGCWGAVDDELGLVLLGGDGEVCANVSPDAATAIAASAAAN
jgi:hypothetical protein